MFLILTVQFFLFVSANQRVPWHGFCQRALPKKQCQLTIVDYKGCAWNCDLQFVIVGKKLFCKIGGDWAISCFTLRLVEGHAIKFAAHQEENNTVLHTRHFPLQCTHRRFVKPIENVHGNYVYQVNQYLKSCLAKSNLGQLLRRVGLRFVWSVSFLMWSFLFLQLCMVVL